MTYLSTRDRLLRAATARLKDNRPFTRADDSKPSLPASPAVSDGSPLRRSHQDLGTDWYRGLPQIA
jgi:hypothetical protein